ncbi:MAG: DUF1573 domain-containing protein [Pirellulales bacterium]
MKARYVVMASGLAGVAMGFGITWANFSDAPPLDVPELSGVAGAGARGQVPKLVVDDTSHDFGLIDRHHTVRHSFRFTNVGTAPLTLKPGTTTCTACTIAELSKAEVAPGETTEVVVEYSPRTAKPEFQQYAVVLTNDPEQPRVELKIIGSVTNQFRMLPDRVVLSNASASQPTTAEVRIFHYLSDKLRVVDCTFDDTPSASFFAATSESIPRGELELDAKSGCRVLVTLNPGLPLGPFRQTIRLQLETGKNGERAEFEVPIEGAVASDLSIVGPGWHGASGVLSFDAGVKSDKGARRELNLLVRGDARRDIRIEPKKLDPPWLLVTVREPVELNESVIRIPVTVEIPPGRPPAIYLGTDQGKFGEIILDVKNHPDLKEIRVHVSFAIGD